MGQSTQKLKVALIGASLLATGATATLAQEDKMEKAAEYYAECANANKEEFADILPKLRAFTDMEVMAETINDPQKLAELSVAVNDPRAIHVMTSCSMEPVMWTTWLKNMTDYNKMAKAMGKAMDPKGTYKWMLAPVDPKIWKTMAKHLSIEKLEDWGTAAVNPTFYKPLTDLVDTRWYGPRIEWFTKSESYAPLLKLVEPLTDLVTEEKKEEKSE